MMRVEVAGRPTKLGRDRTSLELIELLGEPIDIHHDLLSQTGG